MSMATGTRPSKMTGDSIPKGYKAGQLQNFSPEQMQLFKSLFSQVQPGNYLSKLAGGDQESFDQLEAPALRQLQELQGQTASRFSEGGGGPRAMSSRRSSGFQNYMGQQTSDFAQQLQSQRMGIQRQALQDLMGISGELLGQRPYERFLTQKQPKQGFGGAIGAGLGAVGGFFAGGPAGALAGGQLGYNVGSAF